jgi:putative membrane protein
LTIAAATAEPWDFGGNGIQSMIEWLLIVGIVIAGIIWYVQRRWRRRVREAARMRDTAGLDLLAKRYARGEIDRSEYLQKRDDILEYQAVPPR